MVSGNNEQQWDTVITPENKLLQFNFPEIWAHRDLLQMLIHRDIVTVYKQTILGPVWYFVQPMLTMIIYIVIFSKVARLSTDGIPPAVFYLSGIIMWNYFSDTFTQTSDVFYKNAELFGKVYFPRIVIPVTKTISGIIKFFIQSVLFVIIYLHYILQGANIAPDFLLMATLLPWLVLMMALLGLGGGMIFSSLTYKYRDLTFLISFGVQLLMFATPVIYPMSIIPEKYLPYLMMNPLSHIIEAWKFVLFGTGQFTVGGLVYAALFSVITFMAGLLIFNRTEKNFMDTV